MKLFKKKDLESNCSCGNCGLQQSSKAAEYREDFSIKVLGSGCQKCMKLEESVKHALFEMNIEIPVEHVTDYAKIASYGVMSTPALVINEVVVSSGKVLSVAEVKTILQDKK